MPLSYLKAYTSWQKQTQKKKKEKKKKLSLLFSISLKLYQTEEQGCISI